jgi:superfamily I DNA and/or RNA helicase
MTTAGAATHQRLMQMVQPDTVMIEEAAEVLESHILAALGKHVQHLILIGDHKQLQPTAACHDLEREYKLNTSLFERLMGYGSRNSLPLFILPSLH